MLEPEMKEFLELLTLRIPRSEYLKRLVLFIQELSGASSVGIRFLGEDGCLPYEVYAGFPPEFLQQDNLLHIKDGCLCTRIVTRTPNLAERVFIDEYGSFCCGDLAKLFSSPPEEPEEWRGHCYKYGYRSIAVIPIRYRGAVTGVIHLADPGLDRVEVKTVGFLEEIAPVVGEILLRYRLEDELRENYEYQRFLNRLLLHSLTGSSVEAIFREAGDALYRALAGYLAGNGISARNQHGRLYLELGTGSWNTDDILWTIPIDDAGESMGSIEITLVSRSRVPRRVKNFAKAVAQALAHIVRQKRYETALDEQYYFLQKLIDSAPNPIFYKDDTLKFRVINKAKAKLLGLPSDKIIGERLTDLIPAEAAKKHHQVDEILLAKPGVLEYESDMEVMGERRHVILNKATVCDKNGKIVGIAGVITDVTDRIRLEKDMAKLERLKLAGDMAIGIGHEIRNPLTTVKGYLQLLGRKPELLIHKDKLTLMLAEIERANAIMTGFLALAKNKAVYREPKDLNEIIRALGPLLQAEAAARNMTVRLDLAEVAELLLDEGEIRQLVLNLAMNGFEAMAEGGELQIKTIAKDGCVRLLIQDDGSGISQELIDKLGTPFFSTKLDGLGLGLAVCFSIAVRHGAEIRFENRSPGTVVNVRFKQDTSEV